MAAVMAVEEMVEGMAGVEMGEGMVEAVRAVVMAEAATVVERVAAEMEEERAAAAREAARAASSAAAAGEAARGQKQRISGALHTAIAEQVVNELACGGGGRVHGANCLAAFAGGSRRRLP